jgi:hypothetical protein
VIPFGVVAGSSSGWNGLFIVNGRTGKSLVPDEGSCSTMPDRDNRADVPKTREFLKGCRSPDFNRGRV